MPVKRREIEWLKRSPTDEEPSPSTAQRIVDTPMKNRMCPNMIVSEDSEHLEEQAYPLNTEIKRYCKTAGWREGSVVDVHLKPSGHPRYIVEYTTGDREELTEKQVETAVALASLTVGSRISVYWKDDEKYYEATITKYRDSRQCFYLFYDFGGREWFDPSRHRFKLIKTEEKKREKKLFETPKSPSKTKKRLSISMGEVNRRFQEEKKAEDEGDDNSLPFDFPGSVAVGARVSIWWPQDKEYYEANVVRVRKGDVDPFYLEFDDGEREWFDLRKLKFRILSHGDEVLLDFDDSQSEKKVAAKKSTVVTDPKLPFRSRSPTPTSVTENVASKAAGSQPQRESDAAAVKEVSTTGQVSEASLGAPTCDFGERVRVVSSDSCTKGSETKTSGTKIQMIRKRMRDEEARRDSSSSDERPSDSENEAVKKEETKKEQASPPARVKRMLIPIGFKPAPTKTETKETPKEDSEASEQVVESKTKANHLVIPIGAKKNRKSGEKGSARSPSPVNESESKPKPDRRLIPIGFKKTSGKNAAGASNVSKKAKAITKTKQSESISDSEAESERDSEEDRVDQSKASGKRKKSKHSNESGPTRKKAREVQSDSDSDEEDGQRGKGKRKGEGKSKGGPKKTKGRTKQSVAESDDDNEDSEEEKKIRSKKLSKRSTKSGTKQNGKGGRSEKSSQQAASDDSELEDTDEEIDDEIEPCPDPDEVMVGSKIGVWWPEDKRYYHAEVLEYQRKRRPFRILYEDDEEEWIDLHKHQFKFLPGSKRKLQGRKKKWLSDEVDASKVKVGTRVAVWWPLETEYFKATVKRVKSGASKPFFLLYDDDDTEWVDLDREKFYIVNSDDESDDSSEDEDNSDSEDEEEEEQQPPAKKPNAKSTKAKKAAKVVEEEDDSSSSSEDEEEEDLVDKITIGARVAIWWDGEGEYFEGTITKTRNLMRGHFIEYDDGDEEWINLRHEKFRLVSHGDLNLVEVDDFAEKDDESDDEPATPRRKPKSKPKPKRRSESDEDSPSSSKKRRLTGPEVLSIPIYQISPKTNETVKIWSSVRKAEQGTGIGRAAIRRVLQNESREELGGYYWRYATAKHSRHDKVDYQKRTEIC